MEEAGKFCSEVLFPLNQVGDREGCTYEGDGVVKTPTGFRKPTSSTSRPAGRRSAAIRTTAASSLPAFVNNALYEMLNSANQYRTMYPLSHGAYECLHAHGAPELQQRYLPKLVTGEWTGTIKLTEPHCGTDLGILRTKAEPNGDGSYSISGTKIFISSGEHDMSKNIIHLVLARLPDAPQGTKGISLFIVPKFIPDAAGEPGERNGIVRLDRAQDGHPRQLDVRDEPRRRDGLDGRRAEQGLERDVRDDECRAPWRRHAGPRPHGSRVPELAHLCEGAPADALADRLKAPDKPADPIIVHPDVRRMLLTQKAYAEGARAFTYWSALQIDKELSHGDEAVRKEAADLVALLTPIIKAFLTDNAFESTNHAMQIYGGHGFISEWGMEQYVRDARINMIYEGTNSIQSLDLLGRKVLGDMGAKLKKFGKLVTEFAEAEGVKPEMAEFINPLADIGDKVQKLTMEIGMKAMQNPDEVGAAAVPYLRTVGHLVFSYFWARMARLALDKEASGDPFYKSKLATARFYFARLLPETASTIRARAGSKTLMEVDESLF